MTSRSNRPSRRGSANAPLDAAHRAGGVGSWTAWLPAAALVAMTLVVYAPTLQAGFIWDDDANVIENPTLRTWDGLRQMWLVPRSIQQYYPLMYTSYWFEFQAWGLAPRGYHLVNLLLHAGAAILVWRLLQRLQVPGAWYAAAIFTVHPVEVESVAWITERKNVLSLLLAIVAILCYLRWEFGDRLPAATSPDEPADSRGRHVWYGLGLVLFALALFAKTVVVTLPPVLLVIVWWQRGKITFRDGLHLVPFFLLAVGLGIVTTWMETYHVGAYGEEFSLPPVERLLLSGRALWFYAGKLAWPAPLVFFYPRWTISAGEWWQYLFPTTAVLLPIALWQLRTSLGRGPLAAVLIYSGVLLPALGFFNIYFTRFAYVSDHFQYHASVALIALVVAALARASEAVYVHHRPLAVALAALPMLGLGYVAHRQTFLYHDLESLYTDTIRQNPEGWVAYANLSEHLDAVGRHDEALQLAEQALRLGPQEPNVHNNMGVFLYKQGQRNGFQPGQLEAATSHLRDALRLDPERIEARKNLALALAAAGKTDEAIAELKSVLQTNPQLAEAHFELGNLLVKKSDMPAAAAQFAEAVALQPDYADALQNLGAATLALGNPQRAIPYFEEVLRLQPNNAQARANLERARALRPVPAP